MCDAVVHTAIGDCICTHYYTDLHIHSSPNVYVCKMCGKAKCISTSIDCDSLIKDPIMPLHLKTFENGKRAGKKGETAES